MFAATNIHTDSAKALLEHGADVNVTANDGSTALMLAASSGDSESVRDLLQLLRAADA
jgi:ankyrin repeat protein